MFFSKCTRNTAFLVVFLPVSCTLANAQTTPTPLPATDVIAVPTYEAAGLYWFSPGGTAGCEARYRNDTSTTWMPTLPLWFDERDNSCRGSMVGLSPGTTYQVEFNLPGDVPARAVSFQTWTHQKPVAKTIAINSGSATFNVAEGGSPAGYVVYQGAAGAVLDAANGSQFNLTINASYVVVRGVTLKGAMQDAIRIAPNVTDVIIEDVDISGWGRKRDARWGTDMDSGIRAICPQPSMQRVTIQRNRIHDPRYPANSWSDGHPAGPSGISFSNCGGNHVIRHNEIYSTNGNYFNDAIGGEDNFSTAGFPNADSDIYANKISHSWDDGIEAEGANENVRIWGNYIDRTAIGIATTVTSVGPVYVFRNVYNRSQYYQKASPDNDARDTFIKAGSDAALGAGRQYFLHNTMLQATQSGLQFPLGGSVGISGTGASQLITNTVSRNNIYHVWKPHGVVYQFGTRNDFANDMGSGGPGDGIYTNFITGTPTYAPGNGWQSEAAGMYQLAPQSPGFGMAVAIPNFNDGPSAPDIGAHQSGTPAMKFGVAASPGPAAVGTVPTATPAPTPTPTPTPTPSPTPTEKKPPGKGK